MEPNIVSAAAVVVAGLGRGINLFFDFLIIHPVIAGIVIVVIFVVVILYRIHKNTPHLAPASRADGSEEKWRL